MNFSKLFCHIEKSVVLHADISVFICARSDVGQSDWFWSNGTIVIDPTFPTSNTSTCQQMTWPLTYDDGINLRPKECGSGTARYMCKVKGKMIFAYN